MKLRLRQRSTSPCRCDQPGDCPDMCANRQWNQAPGEPPGHPGYPPNAGQGWVPPGPTLSSLKPGERARVEGLGVPQAVKKRLLSLGLTWGTEVAVISKEGGRMIIAVRDSRLGLGPETAARIQCRPA